LINISISSSFYSFTIHEERYENVLECTCQCSSDHTGTSWCY